MYSISLLVKGRACLVVGGGAVASRKVEGLLKEGADVTVIAPEIEPWIETLASENKITLHRRPYRNGEAATYRLVLAATNDREVNRRVFEDAERANVWANVADDPPLCAFHLPSRVERGGLTVSISSGGDAPFAVRRLRQMLERRLRPEWGEWLEAAGAFRRRVRGNNLPFAMSERLYDRFFEETVNESTLAARVPTQIELDDWFAEVSAPNDETPPESAREVESAPTAGLVSLVGGGPGDPGLLTVKGRDRLLRADAVVCDRLAQGVLPLDLAPSIAIHFVGKTAGRHPIAQEEINALLIRLSKEGKRVVRLKGGDPFVFGRGGEEALALAEAGIPFEVVPGVTAATGATAYAGIPVTFRKESVRVTLLTAHEAVKTDGPQVRLDLLAKDPHSMILGYMGTTTLEKVMSALQAHGMDPSMPAAVIEKGTGPAQRTVTGTVADIAVKAKNADIEPPSLFAVGRTISLAETLDWFSKRPLHGERLISFRRHPELDETLSLAGAEVLQLPVPVTEAARLVMDALPLTGGLFFEADDVDRIEDERDRASWIKSPIAWCLSDAARKRARALGWADARTAAPETLTAAMKTTRRTSSAMHE